MESEKSKFLVSGNQKKYFNMTTTAPCFSTGLFSCWTGNFPKSDGTRLLFRLHGLASPSTTLFEIYHCLSMPTNERITRQFAELSAEVVNQNQGQTWMSIREELGGNLAPQITQNIHMQRGSLHSIDPRKFPILTFDRITDKMRHILDNESKFNEDQETLRQKANFNSIGLRSHRREKLVNALSTTKTKFEKQLFTDASKSSNFVCSTRISGQVCQVRPLSNVIVSDGVIGRLQWPQKGHIDTFFEEVLEKIVKKDILTGEICEFLNPTNILVLSNDQGTCESCVINPVCWLFNKLHSFVKEESYEQKLLSQGSFCSFLAPLRPINWGLVLRNSQQSRKMNLSEREEIAKGVTWLLIYDHISNVVSSPDYFPATVLTKIQAVPDEEKLEVLLQNFEEGDQGKNWSGSVGALLVLSRMSLGAQKLHPLSLLKSNWLYKELKGDADNSQETRVDKIYWAQLMLDFGLVLLDRPGHIRSFYQDKTSKSPQWQSNCSRYKGLFYFSKLLMYQVQDLILQINDGEPYDISNSHHEIIDYSDRLNSIISKTYMKFDEYKAPPKGPVSVIKMRNKEELDANKDDYRFIESLKGEKFGSYCNSNSTNRLDRQQMRKNMATLEGKCKEEREKFDGIKWRTHQSQQERDWLELGFKNKLYWDLLLKLSPQSYAQLRHITDTIESYEVEAQKAEAFFSQKQQEIEKVQR